MKTTLFIAFVAMVAAALGGPTVRAEGAPTTVEGEVVGVTQQTHNAGALDVLMIRTRQGEEMRLLLGEAGTIDGRVREGDRIRARLTSGGTAQQGYAVRSMKVRGTGEKLQFRDSAGDMLQTRARDRARDGTGAGAGGERARDRARVHEPGSAGCPAGTGAGTRGGQSRGGGRR